jgi:hypothetical protein
MTKEVYKEKIAEFESMLRAHDWWFEFSDDHSKYRKGMEERRNIFALMYELGPQAELMFDQYNPKKR